MFHLFADLPPELRANVWDLALNDDYQLLYGCSRFIEIHSYNPTLAQFSITISRRYPTLYHVTRESRYEAAKLEGGEWITLNKQYRSKTRSSSRTGVEMYVNFSRDTFLISARFTTLPIETALPRYCRTAEEARLTYLTRVVGAPFLKKMIRLHTSS